MDIVMQHQNEISRVVVHGRRTDDGDRCTFIVVRELGETWGLYPHGANQLGVRLNKEGAVKMARAILAAAE